MQSEAAGVQPTHTEHDAHDDRSEKLLNRIAELTGLSHDDALKALHAVLCVFEERLSGGEVRRMEEELPPVVRDAHQACVRLDPELPETFDRSELFRRASTRLPGGGLNAGRVAAAVLAAIRERLSEREAVRIGNNLPADLRALWEEPLPQEVPFAPLRGLQRNKARQLTLTELAAGKLNHSRVNVESFLQDIARRATLSEPDAESVAVATLWFLEQRIPGRQAERLNEELPRELQVQLQDAELHGDAVPDWDLDTYYSLVTQELGVDKAHVVPWVHHVFAAVKAIVQDETQRMMASLLPSAMKEVFLAA